LGQTVEQTLLRKGLHMQVTPEIQEMLDSLATDTVEAALATFQQGVTNSILDAFKLAISFGYRQLIERMEERNYAIASLDALRPSNDTSASDQPT
jgi:hypothetical protein